LNSIPLGDENEIISYLEGQKDTIKIAVGEVMFRLVFVHDDPLAGQGLSNLIIHFTPFFFVGVNSRYTREAGEEPFRDDVDGVGARSLFLLVKLGFACSDIESNKVLNGAKIGGSHVVPSILTAGRLFIGRR